MSPNLPEEAKIELTYKCNLSCDFCFNKNSYIKKELNKKKIFKIIDDIADSAIEAVRFTGGEPFLRKDLKDILKYAKNKKLYVILNTNGILINKKNIDIFNFVDDCLVSLHHLRNLKKYKQLFKKLKKYNLVLRVCTILVKENIKNLENFYKFIIKQEIDDWFLLRQIPTPNNLNPINNKDIKELIEKIILFNKKYKIKTYIANALPFCSYEPEKTKLVCVGGRNDDCRTRIVIDSAGNIKPSYFSNKVLGNIKKDRIIDCWNSRYMKNIRDLKLIPKECKECNYLRECNGGLRFAAELVNRSYIALDPLANPPNTNNIKVSIITPTYNNKKMLELVLISLFKQDFPKENYEIIVVDDGSTDNTAKFFKKLMKKEHSLKYLWQKDLGFRAGQARNLGAKNALGSLLIFLDDDTVVPTNFIKNHIKAHEKADVILGYNSSYGANQSYKYNKIKNIVEKDIKKLNNLKIIKEFRDKLFNDDFLRSSKTNPKLWFVFAAGNLSIEKNLFLKYMFDEDFVGWAEEDVEFGYRLFKDGINILMDKSCLAFNLRKNRKMISMLTKDKFISTTKNELLLYKKHPDFKVKEYILDRYVHAPEKFRKNTKLDIDNLLFEYEKN